MLVTPLVLIEIFSKRMLVDWSKCRSDPQDEGALLQEQLFNYKLQEDGSASQVLRLESEHHHVFQHMYM